MSRLYRFKLLLQMKTAIEHDEHDTEGALCSDIFLMASKESINVHAACRRTQLYYVCII